MKTNANNRSHVIDQPIPSIPNPGVEILLADASVAQLHVLLEGLRPGVEVHLISAHDETLMENYGRRIIRLKEGQFAS